MTAAVLVIVCCDESKYKEIARMICGSDAVQATHGKGIAVRFQHGNPIEGSQPCTHFHVIVESAGAGKTAREIALSCLAGENCDVWLRYGPALGLLHLPNASDEIDVPWPPLGS